MTVAEHTTDRGEETMDRTRSITAIICTRNRGDSILQTIETILANTFPWFELIVVDQSTDERTTQAVARFCTDPRIRYIRLESKGKARACNIGLRAANSEVVVLTDDDCAVPTDWLEKMHAAFTQHPGVAVVFCNVAAASHDHNSGFIPAYMRNDSRLLTRSSDKIKSRGIGAGLAVLRDPILAMGGFDEMLGPGEEFGDAEDDDVALRALIMGYHVYLTNSVSVTHFGFRTFEQGKNLARRSWGGLGAAYAKPLKAGYWGCWTIPAHEFFVVIVGSMVRDVLRLNRPRGFTRVSAFIRGFIQGLKTPIDRDTLCFRPSE